MAKKICLITTGHISSNPRLVKEASTLCESGYQIHIIFLQNLEFLIQHDETILKANPTWTFDVLSNTDSKLKNKLSRLFRLLFAKITLLTFKWAFSFNNFAINRNYYWQLKKAIKTKADLYIAHNLGALPVAINVAKKNNAKCGFDAEDFHRQEVTNNTNSLAYRLTKSIEDRYLSKVNYLTTASPLIAQVYQKLYPKLNPIVINNVFSNEFLQDVNPSTQNKNLKLFWFSQTIGKERGLEDVIQSLKQLNNPLIELHLLGNLSKEDKSYFNKLSAFEIKYHKPIIADDIFKLAKQFDIGLALELNIPFNRDICLTNKIFTYLTSGLALIASETDAQKQFLKENPTVGKSYPISDIDTLASLIINYDENRALLNQTKINALELAKTKYNWENESSKFLNIVKKTLND